MAGVPRGGGFARRDVRREISRALHAFWHSPQYVAAKKLREGAAELDVWAVPGA
jgi:uncharacterized protein (DUF1330 family)